MEHTDVPLIFAPSGERHRLGVVERLTILATGLCCLGVLVVAAGLKPNPNGLGTHRGMGLEGCSFLNTTGLPCPSCGMTTSFAWFARGNIVASAYVQPMGMVLAAACAAWFWVAVWTAVSGRPVYRLMRFVPGRYWSVPLLGVAVLAWMWKMFIHVKGLDGWGR